MAGVVRRAHIHFCTLLPARIKHKLLDPLFRLHAFCLALTAGNRNAFVCVFATAWYSRSHYFNTCFRSFVGPPTSRPHVPCSMSSFAHTRTRRFRSCFFFLVRAFADLLALWRASSKWLGKHTPRHRINMCANVVRPAAAAAACECVFCRALACKVDCAISAMFDLKITIQVPRIHVCVCV